MLFVIIRFVNMVEPSDATEACSSKTLEPPKVEENVGTKVSKTTN